MTEAGEILYKHAVNILNTRELALFSLAQYEGKLKGELGIAASTVPQGYILPKLLTAFHRRYPQITYRIKHYDSGGVLQAISSGAVDFGFVGTPVQSPHLEAVELCQSRLVEEEFQQGLLKRFFLEDLELKQVFYFITHKNRVLSPIARAFKEFTLEYMEARPESCSLQ